MRNINEQTKVSSTNQREVLQVLLLQGQSRITEMVNNFSHVRENGFDSYSKSYARKWNILGGSGSDVVKKVHHSTLTFWQT